MKPTRSIPSVPHTPEETAFEFETLAVRAGQARSAEGEHSEALFLTSSFMFEDAEQAAARFAHQVEGNIYSRFTNPTVRMFEQRLAALEGGERCIATASGMSAILTWCLGVLQAGDTVVASRSLFGTTTNLFNGILKRFGVQTVFVDLVDLSQWKQAVEKYRPRFLYLETPSNPLNEIADIQALAEIAHRYNSLLVVDNCFCTPALQRPLSLGADVVIHSATKYIDGQGRCLGGAIVGTEALMGKDVYGVLRTTGTTMSAFNAWVFLKGLETLALRMSAHSRNALEIATWLEQHPKVARVHYSGLVSHPQHELAKRQQSGFGGIVAFEVKGDKAATWRMIDATTWLSLTGNLGDTKTTITHPATTTHGRLSPEERQAAGIQDSLVRLSIGLEHVADIQADLERGLAAV